MVLLHHQYPRCRSEGNCPIITFNSKQQKIGRDIFAASFQVHPFSRKAEGGSSPPGFRILSLQRKRALPQGTLVRSVCPRVLRYPTYCSTVVLHGADGIPLAITVNVPGPSSVSNDRSKERR